MRQTRPAPIRRVSPPSDLRLVAWLNALPLANGATSAALCDVLLDITTTVVRDVCEGLDIRRTGQPMESLRRTRQLGQILRAFETRSGYELALEDPGLKLSEDFVPGDITSRRDVVRAIWMTWSALEHESAGARQDSINHTFRHESPTRRPTTAPAPAPRRSSNTVLSGPEVANRLRKAIHTMTTTSTRPLTPDVYQAIADGQTAALLSSGLVLCRIVRACEARLPLLCGVGSKDKLRDSVARRMPNGEVELFVPGVDTNPRTRAARTNNMEIALRSMREWKKLAPTYLYATEGLVNQAPDVGLGLLSDIATAIESTLATNDVSSSKAADAQDEDWDDWSPVQGGEPETAIVPSLPKKLTDVTNCLVPLDVNVVQQHHRAGKPIKTIKPAAAMRSSRLPPLFVSLPGVTLPLERCVPPTARRTNESAARLAREWLYRVGFNILRVNQWNNHPSSLSSHSESKFFGYEGGPFLGDPLRNGRVLEIVADLVSPLASRESLIRAAGQHQHDNLETCRRRLDAALSRLGMVDHSKLVESILSGEPRVIWGLLASVAETHPVPTRTCAWERRVLVTRCATPSAQEESFSTKNYLDYLSNSGASCPSMSESREAVLRYCERSLASWDARILADVALDRAEIASRVTDGDRRLLMELLARAGIVVRESAVEKEIKGTRELVAPAAKQKLSRALLLTIEDEDRVVEEEAPAWSEYAATPPPPARARIALEDAPAPSASGGDEWMSRHRRRALLL